MTSWLGAINSVGARAAKAATALRISMWPLAPSASVATGTLQSSRMGSANAVACSLSFQRRHDVSVSEFSSVISNHIKQHFHFDYI